MDRRSITRVGTLYEVAAARLAKLEPRDSGDSFAAFFEERNDAWYPIEGALRFVRRDLFVIWIAGELVFRAVQIPHESY